MKRLAKFALTLLIILLTAGAILAIISFARRDNWKFWEKRQGD